jgi:isochorismate hydrolase
MQKYFLSPQSHAYVPSAAAIVLRVRKLAEAYVTKGLPVILTQHINTEEDAKLMRSWWKDLLTKGSPMSELIDALRGLEAVHVLKKCQYDAFYGTPLESMLHAEGVERVVICGVMTHLCCESTARSAFIRGFQVFFTIDGTATYTEDFHRATLLNLAHGFATPVLIDTVLHALEDLPKEGALCP